MKTTLAILACLAAGPVLAQDETPLPKLGENATPITAATDYLRQNPAPDYWAFDPFVKPQFTTSACSIAAVTAAVNGLAGLPALAEDTVLTQPAVLDLVGSDEWAAPRPVNSGSKKPPGQRPSVPRTGAYFTVGAAIEVARSEAIKQRPQLSQAPIHGRTPALCCAYRPGFSPASPHNTASIASVGRPITARAPLKTTGRSISLGCAAIAESSAASSISNDSPNSANSGSPARTIASAGTPSARCAARNSSSEGASTK